jgi:hypothetical protein
MQNGTLSEKLYDFLPVFHATSPFARHIAAAKADQLKPGGLNVVMDN